MKLFLDDVRSPSDCSKYMQPRIGKLNPIYLEGDWYIVRNYKEFTEALTKYANEITHISYDHDLADEHYHETMYDSAEVYLKHLALTKEKTGYDCALFMKQYYKTLDKPWPVMFVHSMNPVGTQRIVDLFKNKKDEAKRILQKGADVSNFGDPIEWQKKDRSERRN